MSDFEQIRKAVDSAACRQLADAPKTAAVARCESKMRIQSDLRGGNDQSEFKARALEKRTSAVR
jgi:hypothetical protein